MFEWNELEDEFVTYMKTGARDWKVNDSWTGSIGKLQDIDKKKTHTHTYLLAG